MARAIFFSMLKDILLVQKGSQTQVTFKVLYMRKNHVQERRKCLRIHLQPRLIS